ncbi:Retrotransposable element Tf2 155 kDa protein type 1 [Rhizoctonia solani AG-1 IB]|uniref:Retrotransposable element Tf2 155 kDa protein type 1 n=1 Tax=Thanatephorus cucumeris (strain AG1-IB / isolate 7/3/14) TaxID=1108050 RepID=M5C3I5_THACB|nr:Retrotransposable element Tf2 155 kDa protein type 1 [Rhizoctonia solani AG-1 IB]
MTLSEPAALKEHIDSELAAGKIRPSTTPAGAPVMLVKRADGRLCLVIFTKLDLRNGYNIICIKKGNKWKAAFRTQYGHFEPTVMQFGLSNAPAVFQHFMNKIFRDLLDITVIVYLDDILIFSNSREEHVQHVTEVLSHFQKHNLFCNPSKCVFIVTEVTYIGLVVTHEGISMEQEKVKAIQEWPEPKNVKQVQSFLGFANFYRCFKDQPWVWEAAQKEAFHQIKIAISQEPVLAHPDESQPYTLETDASGAAMGAVFPPAELSYDTHDKELLAIIHAFEHWRIFLEGTEHPVTVLTDHKNLEYWNQPECSTGAMRAGISSSLLTTLFLHTGPENRPRNLTPCLEFGAEITTLLLPQIKEALQNHPSLDTVMAATADPDSMTHSITAKFKDYTLQDSLLLYQGRIVVPDKPEIKQQLLSHFHDSPGSGHQGRARTLDPISCHYYWPAMKFQVNCYVESSEICQRNKEHVQHFALKPLSVPAGPWEDVSYDFIVKLPKCRGNDSILIVVDCFSKMVHFIPCKETATAEDVAQLFLEHVWKLHGTPKQTVSDSGPTFNSKFLRALYKALHIAPSYSTAYHPQSDGQTEIKNQWLEAYLCPFINHRQSDWVDWLPLAELAHNNARSEPTGKSPFEIGYGCSPMISPAQEPTGSPAADDRAKQLADTIQEVQASIKWAQERYKQADKGKQPLEFAPGDKIISSMVPSLY